MWAPIIGNRLPNNTTIGDGTPVSSGGRTTCSGMGTWPRAVPRVVPVDPEEVAGIGGVGVDIGERIEDLGGKRRRVRELGEGGQDDALLAETVDRALVGARISDLGEQAETAGVDQRRRGGRQVVRSDLNARPF